MPASPLSTPEISVVFPLVDGRVDGIKAVQSWTHLQTIPRDRYQVVAVSDGSDPDADHEIAQLLAPHDLLVCHPTHNFLELYDVGIRRARGRLVVLTEHHCLAHPDCLIEVERFFQSHEYDGACLNIEWLCMNEVARLKWNQRNQERLSFFKVENHWNKFLFAGFAIRRDKLLRIGGIDFQYGLFLEVAVGAMLHHEGFRLGHIQQARVQHLDNNSFRKVLDFIRNFTEGEVKFLRDHEAEFCQRYFGNIRNGLIDFRITLSWGACTLPFSGSSCSTSADGAALVASMLWPGNSSNSFSRQPYDFHPFASRAAKHLPRCWQFHLSRFNEPRRLRTLNDACDRMVHYVRMKSIAEQNIKRQDRSLTQPRLLPAPTRWDIGMLSDDELIGFHTQETMEGKAYRWSKPVATLRLDLAPSHYEVRIDTRGFRGRPEEYLLACVWNDYLVPTDDMQFNNDVVTFSVSAEHFVADSWQQLTLVIRPLLPSRSSIADRRRLGIPIFSIEVREQLASLRMPTEDDLNESKAA